MSLALYKRKGQVRSKDENYTPSVSNVENKSVYIIALCDHTTGYIVIMNRESGSPRTWLEELVGPYRTYGERRKERK